MIYIPGSFVYHIYASRTPTVKYLIEKLAYQIPISNPFIVYGHMNSRTVMKTNK